MSRSVLSSLFLALLLSFLTLPAAAQTVDMEIPQEIEVVPDQLSVTFAAGVNETQAREVIAEMGHTVLSAEFPDLLVYAAADTVLSPAADSFLKGPLEALSYEQLSVADGMEALASKQVQAFLEANGELGVEVLHHASNYPPPARSVRSPDFDERTRSAYEVLVRFSPTFDAKVVERRVNAHPELFVRRTVARSNEVIIQIDPARDAEITAALEAHPLVEYVVYVAAQ